MIHISKTYGFISIRIPRSNTDVLSNIIRDISEKIIRENLYSNDVTDQYSDLSARINNMKVAEQTYLRLFNEAKSIEDMVNIQEKINEIRKAFTVREEDKNYENLLIQLSEIKSYTDNFFDNVIVNDENSDIKKNRLELLQMFCKTYDNFVDFSKVEGI